MEQQETKVIKRLREVGFVSRNWALKNYISRLGAIINSLVGEGWKFDDKPSKQGGVIMRGRFIKTRFGTDYVYYLVSAPKRK